MELVIVLLVIFAHLYFLIGMGFYLVYAIKHSPLDIPILDYNLQCLKRVFAWPLVVRKKDEQI